MLTSDNTSGSTVKFTMESTATKWTAIVTNVYSDDQDIDVLRDGVAIVDTAGPFIGLT